MMNDDTLRAELARIPRLMRAAFALGCADRVAMIYDELAEPRYDSVSLARELGWEFASGSRNLEEDQALLADAIESIKKTLPDTESRPGQSTVLSAALVTLAALEAVSDESAESAFTSAMSALDAIDEADEEGDGVEEEQEWQERAFALAKQSSQNNAERKLFESIAQQPQWQKRFIAEFS